MIGRLGLRRVLPVIFTAIHITLLISAWEESHVAVTLRASHPIVCAVLYQEEGAPRWNPRPGPPPLTNAQKIAMFLNFPALLLALPFAIFIVGDRSMGLLYTSTPFVPIVWYVIGRWLDSVSGRLTRRFVLPQALSGLFALLSAGLLIASACAVTPLNHHRRADTYWGMATLAFWSGLSLAMSLSSFYRRYQTATLSR